MCILVWQCDKLLDFVKNPLMRSLILCRKSDSNELEV
jgi:hypothetical protein